MIYKSISYLICSVSPITTKQALYPYQTVKRNPMLTNNKIKLLKPKEKAFKVSDLYGLYVFVAPSGSKTFRLDYTLGGKRKTHTIGSCTLFSVEQARDMVLEVKRKLKLGTPLTATAVRSFKEVGIEFCKLKDYDEKHKQTRRLELYVYPVIGDYPIDAIKPPDVVKLLRPIEARGTVETAHRVLNIVSQTLRYAVALGELNTNATRDLIQVLKSANGGNFRAITDPKELALYLQAAKSYKGSLVVAKYLQIAPYLFMRPSELRCLKWTDIDLEKGRIDYFVTKVKKPHTVFLSQEVTELLTELKTITGKYGYAFSSMQRGDDRPISDNAALIAIKRMGIDTTVHGFRATARTLMTDVLKASPEVIEFALSHKVDTQYNGAYNRAKYLDERITLYSDWARYLTSLSITHT